MYVAAVTHDVGVRRDESDSLELSLRYEHPVKWVSVNHWQLRGDERVVRRDCQFCCGHFMQNRGAASSISITLEVTLGIWWQRLVKIFGELKLARHRAEVPLCGWGRVFGCLVHIHGFVFRHSYLDVFADKRIQIRECQRFAGHDRLELQRPQG